MGRLVDVSAGGVRARAEHWGGVRPGEPVDVEITVQDSLESTPPPLVQLRGAALVVRLDEVPGQEACAALRFVGPLTMREPFAQMLLF